jgi:hypothetical protein
VLQFLRVCLSITHVHSCHHRIIVDDHFGLLDVLASNPSLDQFFVMSVFHKTNGFLVFPLHNYQVIGQFLAEKVPLVISLFLLCLLFTLWTSYLVRFQVLTAVSLKMRAFWDIVPCSRWMFQRCVLPLSSGHSPVDGDRAHL